MQIANDGQSYLAKYIKERELVFKALKIGIFSRLEQPEKSGQSSNDVKYSSVGRDLYELSKKLQDGLLKLDGISNDSDIQSFTPIKKRNRT